MRRAFTLIELMVTVSALIIVLGLMASLARFVRERAAVALTKDLLRQLDDLTTHYLQQNNGHLPDVSPFPPVIKRTIVPGPPSPESAFDVSSSDEVAPERGKGPAAESAAAGARTGLAAQIRPASGIEAFDPSTVPEESNPSGRQLLREAALANNRGFVAAFRKQFGTPGPLDLLPASIYDPEDSILLDAWGMPIVLMPAKHPMVGTAPNNRFFFFSAGADRRFWTQDDNLYSYEDLGVQRDQKGSPASP